ncbi:MAG: MBL fold metallo-hydrolase [Rhodospirillaceae bacterium]|nr:MBL fold metallo-hydrolase [Rhodospirillaceae bacterium]
MAFAVKFWGVRGSIATQSPRHVGFGGNTSCVEVIAGDEVYILDCGTGVRNLGMELMKRDIKFANILMSHTHWDHINGFPFFLPAYNENCRFNMWAGHLMDDGGVQKIMSGQMTQPMFPVPLAAMRSKIEFHDFRAGDELKISNNVNINTMMLNHPNGATAYRIEHGGKAMVYVTDTEHVIGTPDQSVLKIIEGADLVIYDSTYTDDEFEPKIGWGHSTWQEGVRLCQAANVKSLAIFHHDPDHEDDFMEKLEMEARAAWDGAFVARENMVIKLL